MTLNNFPSQGRRCSCGFLFQCLVEAVCILDCVCVEDPSLVYRTFPCIKALFGRLSSDLSFARVLLPIAQFYLNHGNARVHHSPPPPYLRPKHTRGRDVENYT